MARKIEGDAILDLSDLEPEERKKLCERLGGIIDEDRGQCLVKISVDPTNPKQIKILKFEYD